MKNLTIGKILSILGIGCIFVGMFQQGKADAQGEEADHLLLAIGVLLMATGIVLDYLKKKKEEDKLV